MTEKMIQLMASIRQWQSEIAEKDLYAFTMDIDWASETAISIALKFFLDNNIPVTIYCTHPSEILRQYRNHSLVRLGIHPNFLPDSSQGTTSEAVVEYLFKLIPDAITMRCHRWFSDNDIYELLVPRGILFDSNEITLMDIMPPHMHRSGILSFPVCWEDGAYLWHNFTLDFSKFGKQIFDRPGLKVINCHPFHFALNTPFYSWTRNLKDRLTREEYTNCGAKELEKYAWTGPGIRNFVMDLAEFANQKNAKCVLLEEEYWASPLGQTNLTDICFGKSMRQHA